MENIFYESDVVSKKEKTKTEPKIKQKNLNENIEDSNTTKIEKDWDKYKIREKLSFILYSTIKFGFLFSLIYLFMLSLRFLSIGFTLVSRYALQAGDIIKFILSNPFAALSIGILLTALMQNATATTSIAVIMVGAGIIPDVKSAVPIVI